MNLVIRARSRRSVQPKHAFFISGGIMIVYTLINLYALIKFPLDQLGNKTEIYACQATPEYQEWYKVSNFHIIATK